MAAPADLDAQFDALSGATPASRAPAAAPDDLDAQFAALQAAPAVAPTKSASAGDWGTAAGSAFFRPIANTIRGVAGPFVDAPVALANLFSGKLDATGHPKPGAMQLPTQDWDSAVDKFAQPATGVGKIGEGLSTALLGMALPSPQFGGAPAGFMSNTPQALRQQVLQQSQNAGYVVPPGTGNPSFMNRLLGGLAGKAKLSQAANAANQPVTDRLAATGLGQRPDAMLTPDALQAIRSEAYAKGYEPIDSFGQMTHTPQFGPKLDALMATVTKAKSAYPGMPQGTSQVIPTLNALKQQPTVDSAGARATVQYLRDQADTAFGGGNKVDGRAYSGAAKALEDEIESNLSAAGQQGQNLLSGFRDARQRIAQTYTVQKALQGEGGTTDALKISRQLAGKPYASGDLKTISDFASAFPKSARVPQEGGESISPLDMYGSIAAAAAAHSLGPLGIPLTRAGLQSYLLSPSGQARALRGVTNAAPRQNLGLLGLAPAASGLLGQ